MTNPSVTSPDLAKVLLSFYECLTDPSQLDSLMEMLTSWLDDADSAVVSPKLDYHADHAWRLLGEFAPVDEEVTSELDGLDVTTFKTAEDVQSALKDQIRPDELEKLDSWLANDAQATALLLRVMTDQTTELVVFSRDPATEGYLCKRTGADFQTIISKFVADSFELTHAEFVLVQELLQGGTLREIAGRLGKSWETTRSQVKTLTNKLGVSSQADILRMVNQAATLMPTQKGRVPSQTQMTNGKLTRPDGRTLVYEVDGPRSDKTLVFLHGMTQGRHWPEKARRLAVSRGWQIVRISRAGRGGSSVNAKENKALLQDHVDDVMAVMDHEGIASFSILGTADGFSVGYPIALQNPERVRSIIGLEVVPPILSRKVIDGFSGKMKTFGLACLYAPKTVKFILGIAMHKLARMEDRYDGTHPLIGVELRKFEDEEGIHADDLNFQDLMMHNAEGMWRDASYSCVDWADAPAHTNLRPRAVLIHCANSLMKSPGHIDVFAQRIGAPIQRIDNYLPYISAYLALVLDTLEPD